MERRNENVQAQVELVPVQEQRVVDVLLNDDVLADEFQILVHIDS